MPTGNRRRGQNRVQAVHRVDPRQQGIGHAAGHAVDGFRQPGAKIAGDVFKLWTLLFASRSLLSREAIRKWLFSDHVPLDF